jgi:hypothetical protein
MNFLNKILSNDTKGSSADEDWYIVAERGEGIRDEDLLGRSDPYLKIEFGGKHFKTRTIKNDRSPTWNETFHCRLSDKQAQDIHLTLMDDDIGLDDTIGKAVVSRQDLTPYLAGERSIQIPLLRKGQVTAIVYLRVKKLVNGQDPMQSYQGSNVSSQQFQQQPQFQQQQQPQFGSGMQQPMNYGGSSNYSSQPYNQQQPQFSSGMQQPMNYGGSSNYSSQPYSQQQQFPQSDQMNQQQPPNFNQGNLNYYGRQ